MIAEPAVFHDKHLIGNGETCRDCLGEGRVAGKRGRTFRRCRPCKGSGRSPLPAEEIIRATRPAAARQVDLVRDAQEARDAARVAALHEDVEAQVAADARPVEVICGIPLPVEFGRRPDETMWLSCGVERVNHVSLSSSASPRATLEFATLLNGLPVIRDALRAARSECRDPDTDAGLSTATGELIENALRALGERL